MVVHEVVGAPQPHRLFVRNRREGEAPLPLNQLGEEAEGNERRRRPCLHVGDAAAEDLAVDDLAAERIALPAAAVADGECVEMTVEDHGAAGAAVGGRYHVHHSGLGLYDLVRMALAFEIRDHTFGRRPCVARRVLARPAHEIAQEPEPLVLALFDAVEDLVASVHGVPLRRHPSPCPLP
jgi:hypothetical protein